MDPAAEEQVDERKRFPLEQIFELLPSLVTITLSATGDREWSKSDFLHFKERRKYEPELAVQLAHFSVKEYLVSSRVRLGNASAFSVQAGLANSFMAKSCIAYITYYAESRWRSSTDSDLRTFPLIEYACANWPGHYSQAAEHSSAEIFDMLVQCLISERWLISAHNVRVLDQPLAFRPFEREEWWEPHASYLYYAAYFGFEALVGGLLSHATAGTLNGRGGVYGTALQAASRGGNIRIVKMLLHAGADVNLVNGKYGTALQAAAKHDYDHIARLLISYGADVNAQGGRFCSALCAAIGFNHEKIFHLLLDAGANPKLVSDESTYLQPIHLAMNAGRDEFLRKMLTPVENESEAKLYSYLLYCAIESGRNAEVKLLLETGAPLHGLDMFGQSALYKAALSGDESLVKWLISNGADINALGGTVGTALQIASHTGHLSIMRLLLSHGADVNIQGGCCGTALQAAVAHGGYINVDPQDGPDCPDLVPTEVRQEVVNLLLDRGANVNAAGGLLGTALQAASYFEDSDLVRLLQERGADLEKGSTTVNGPSCLPGKSITDALFLAGLSPLNSTRNT